MNARHVAAFAAALFAAPLAAHAGAAMFEDGAFPPANYASVGSFAENGASISYGTCAACGDPGAGLDFTIDFVSSMSSVATDAVFNTTWTYDSLTQGAISEVAASADKNVTLSVATAGDTFATAFRPAILQDGAVYAATIAGANFVDPSTGPFATGFQHFGAVGLQASDFTLFDPTTGTFGSGSPNFAGDTLTLGVLQYSDVSFATVDHNIYDNLSFTLGVPEPAGWAMMLVGFGVTGAALRRRRCPSLAGGRS